MTPGDAGLVLFVVQALGHAATHMVADSAKEKVLHHLTRPERLRNRDVERAVVKAKRAALGKLRAEYRTEHEEDRTALETFDALIDLAGTADERTEEGNADAWLSTERAPNVVRDLLAGLERPAPTRVRRFLEERFPAMFVFAFREVGLKGDEKVRSVIFETMLRKISDSNTALSTDLAANDRALAAGLGDLGHRIERSEATLAEMVTELRREVVRAGVAVNSDLLGDGPVLGYVRISDESGGVIRTETVRRREMLIGRGGRTRGVALQLDDRRVSREHARLTFDEGGVVVVDQASTHGTRVQGRRIDDPERIEFGSSLTIGPYRLEVLGPGTRLDERVTPPTERPST